MQGSFSVLRGERGGGNSWYIAAKGFIKLPLNTPLIATHATHAPPPPPRPPHTHIHTHTPYWHRWWIIQVCWVVSSHQTCLPHPPLPGAREWVWRSPVCVCVVFQYCVLCLCVCYSESNYLLMNIINRSHKFLNCHSYLAFYGEQYSLYL